MTKPQGNSIQAFPAEYKVAKAKIQGKKTKKNSSDIEKAGGCFNGIENDKDLAPICWSLSKQWSRGEGGETKYQIFAVLLFLSFWTLTWGGGLFPLLFKACDLNVWKYQKKFVNLVHFKHQGIGCCQFHAKTHCCQKERVKLCDTKGISSAWFTAFTCQTKIPWDCGGITGFGQKSKSFPFLELHTHKNKWQIFA